MEDLRYVLKSKKGSVTYIWSSGFYFFKNVKASKNIQSYNATFR